MVDVMASRPLLTPSQPLTSVQCSFRKQNPVLQQQGLPAVSQKHPLLFGLLTSGKDSKANAFPRQRSGLGMSRPKRTIAVPRVKRNLTDVQILELIEKRLNISRAQSERDALSSTRTSSCAPLLQVSASTQAHERLGGSCRSAINEVASRSSENGDKKDILHGGESKIDDKNALHCSTNKIAKVASQSSKNCDEEDPSSVSINRIEEAALLSSIKPEEEEASRCTRPSPERSPMTNAKETAPPEYVGIMRQAAAVCTKKDDESPTVLRTPGAFLTAAELVRNTPNLCFYNAPQEEYRPALYNAPREQYQPTVRLENTQEDQMTVSFDNDPQDQSTVRLDDASKENQSTLSLNTTPQKEYQPTLRLNDASRENQPTVSLNNPPQNEYQSIVRSYNAPQQSHSTHSLGNSSKEDQPTLSLTNAAQEEFQSTWTISDSLDQDPDLCTQTNPTKAVDDQHSVEDSSKWTESAQTSLEKEACPVGESPTEDLPQCTADYEDVMMHSSPNPEPDDDVDISDSDESGEVVREEELLKETQQVEMPSRGAFDYMYDRLITQYSDITDDEEAASSTKTSAVQDNLGLGQPSGLLVNSTAPGTSLGVQFEDISDDESPRQAETSPSSLNPPLSCTCPYFYETEDGFEEGLCPKCARDAPVLTVEDDLSPTQEPVVEVDSEDDSDDDEWLVFPIIAKEVTMEDVIVVEDSESADEEEECISSAEQVCPPTVEQANQTDPPELPPFHRIPEYDSIDSLIQAKFGSFGLPLERLSIISDTRAVSPQLLPSYNNTRAVSPPPSSYDTTVVTPQSLPSLNERLPAYSGSPRPLSSDNTTAVLDEPLPSCSNTRAVSPDPLPAKDNSFTSETSDPGPSHNFASEPGPSHNFASEPGPSHYFASEPSPSHYLEDDDSCDTDDSTDYPLQAKRNYLTASSQVRAPTPVLDFGSDSEEEETAIPEPGSLNESPYKDYFPVLSSDEDSENNANASTVAPSALGMFQKKTSKSKHENPNSKTKKARYKRRVITSDSEDDDGREVFGSSARTSTHPVQSVPQRLEQNDQHSTMVSGKATVKRKRVAIAEQNRKEGAKRKRQSVDTDMSAVRKASEMPQAAVRTSRRNDATSNFSSHKASNRNSSTNALDMRKRTAHTRQKAQPAPKVTSESRVSLTRQLSLNGETYQASNLPGNKITQPTNPKPLVIPRPNQVNAYRTDKSTPAKQRIMKAWAHNHVPTRLERRVSFDRDANARLAPAKSANTREHEPREPARPRQRHKSTETQLMKNSMMMAKQLTNNAHLQVSGERSVERNSSGGFFKWGKDKDNRGLDYDRDGPSSDYPRGFYEPD